MICSLNSLRPASLPMLLVLLAAGHASAQITPGIIGDRPSQLAPLSEPGTIQFGTGITFESVEPPDEPDASSRLYMFGMLLRTGMSESAELRIGFEVVDEMHRHSEGELHMHGLRNLSIGTKLGLVDEEGMTPALSLFANAHLPFGGDDYSPSSLIPGIQLQADYDFDGRLMVTGNMGGEWQMGTSELLTTYTTTIAVPLNEEMAAFGDIAGEFSPSASPAHVCDLGITFAFHDHLQLDLACGLGLAGGAPDYFVNSGFSYRVP